MAGIKIDNFYVETFQEGKSTSEKNEFNILNILVTSHSEGFKVVIQLQSIIRNHEIGKECNIITLSAYDLKYLGAFDKANISETWLTFLTEMTFAAYHQQIAFFRVYSQQTDLKDNIPSFIGSEAINQMIKARFEKINYN